MKKETKNTIIKIIVAILASIISNYVYDSDIQIKTK
jgi:hypothetical protein